MARKKYTIEDMQNIAKSRGGKCLSTEYINTETKLRWQCEEGHVWESTPSHIIHREQWCPICGRIKAGKSRRLTIEEMQEIAKSRNGVCLSTSYIDNSTKLKWRCNKGHEWMAAPSHIKLGKWCPYCAGKYKKIDDMKNLAKERGGECLSNKYVNSETKLTWCCSEGHIWEAVYPTIKRGSWCPYCAGQHRSIEDMQAFASQKEGKCLSDTFIGMNSNLTWQCKVGHTWEQRPATIFAGHWCPVCSTGVSERICRETFQRLFNLPFPKKRPKWLINPQTGKRMELDGYCEELSLAFEYHGKQHYQQIPYFYDGKKSSYEMQKFKDEHRRKVCEERGIALIEVPYHIPFESMPSFIIQECKSKGVEIERISLDIFDYKSFDVYSPQLLKEMQEIAMERGGECLSSEYVKAILPLKWRCGEGHKWEATPHSIKRGSWCPYCAGVVKLTIEEMRQIAKDRGGKCLSDEYVNWCTKLKWQCSEGHIWEATPNMIKSRTWCPICGRKKVEDAQRGNIEEMHQIAENRGGECLSDTYVNNSTKLKWRCGKGHEWENSPGHIKQGQWCPYCSGKAKLTINDMKQIAKERGGKCLSRKYINVETKLKWECDKGHEWEARPSNIKRGDWCPICGRIKAGKSRRLTIEEMCEIAKKQNGLCQSENYIDSRTKLKWKCDKGHEWEASPNSIKNGSWCPKCSYIKRGLKTRGTIEEMQQIANNKNGECLSKEYVNNSSKLKWKCDKDHVWEADPSHIKRGQWCPICAKEKRKKPGASSR